MRRKVHKVGDKVICVDYRETWREHPKRDILTIISIYSKKSIISTNDGWSWTASRFINTNDMSQLEKLIYDVEQV